MADIENVLNKLVQQAASDGVVMHRENLNDAGDEVSVEELQRLTLELGEALIRKANAADRMVEHQ